MKIMNFYVIFHLVALLMSLTSAQLNSEISPESAGGVDNARSESITKTSEQESSIGRDIANFDSTSESRSTKLKPKVLSDPFVELLGSSLLSLEIVNETSAQLQTHSTSEVLRQKKVIGLYFSADWCGPCQKFTPELVTFYDKMNKRRGRNNEFEIIWVSRCRDVNSYGQYFTKMGGWYALPPEEAMGERGTKLAEYYKAKSIPTLVLLDGEGGLITADARNKIPQDKAGIGFPWRNPFATLYINTLPKSLRFLIKSQIRLIKDTIMNKIKSALRFMKPFRA